LHLGANQVTAQVLMGQRGVAPGESAFAILRCEAPIVAEYGQPFVLRQPSPARTIGGGAIILPALRTADRQGRCLAAAADLASNDAHRRLAAYLDLHGETRFDASSESRLGLSLTKFEAAIAALESRGEVVSIAGSPPIVVGARRFQQLQELFVRRVHTELERRRPASLVLLSVILSAMKRHASPAVLESLLHKLVAKREIVWRGERVGLPSGAELSNRQRGMLAAFVADVSGAGPAPPTLREFAERGMLVRLTPQLAMDRVALESLRQRLARHFDESPTAKVGEIREQWGITRKHAVPIFEFFDQVQITSRAGDIRSAGPRVSIPLGEAVT
jgi:selenocysteine-specific elongation factor